MGKLHYGTNVHFDIDDHSLAHLDAILQRIRGTAFQLHVVGLSGPADGNLASLSITTGVNLWIEYYNGPDITIDIDTINYGVFTIQTAGLLILPIRTSDSQSSEIRS